MGETPLRSFGTWFRDNVVPNKAMRRFTIQLLIALDYAHDYGVIHTGDWGVASLINSHLCKVIQVIALRSPEVLIDAPWGLATDLWNLGAVILEVFRAVRMFSGRGPDRNYAVQFHLHEIVDLFGPFPKALLQKGDQTLVKEYFDDKGYVKLPPLKRLGLESEAFLNPLPDPGVRQLDPLASVRQNRKRRVTVRLVEQRLRCKVSQTALRKHFIPLETDPESCAFICS
ncbi:hypothetical protein FQN57_001872 [Myotisia sp. PD_48]|nr:hypothetical protein FQN57_001872 [Myotisia sp. PD_48]